MLPGFIWFLLICNTYSYHFPSSFNGATKMNWTSAEQHCIDTFNGHLVSIHNDDEFEDIKQEIISLGKQNENFWIGLRNINNGSNINDYNWSDGTAFDFGMNINGGIYPWQNYSNAPNNEYEKYIRLWGIHNLLWDDVKGDTKWYWICNNNTISINNTSTEYPSYSTLLIQPSYSPTKSPIINKDIKVTVETYLGILSIITFDYVELEDNNTFIHDIIDNILQNINTSICIHSYEFNMNITENNQYKTAVIIAFIDICNNGMEIENKLIIDFEHSLQTDFIYLINNITSIEIDKQSLDISVSITTNSDDLHSYSTTNVINPNGIIFAHNVRIFPFEIYLFLSLIIICCICVFSCLFVLFINKHEMSIQNKTIFIDDGHGKPSKIHCDLDALPPLSPALSAKDSEQMLTVSQSMDHSITFPVHVEKPEDIRGSDTDFTDDLFDILSPNTTPSGYHLSNNNHSNNNSELSPFQIPTKLQVMVDVILERHEDDSVEELFKPTVTSPGNETDINCLRSPQTMGSDGEFASYQDKASVEGISSDTENDQVLSARL